MRKKRNTGGPAGNSRWRRAIMPLLLVILATSCRDEERPHMTGVWEAIEPELEVRLTLQESGERIVGSGFIRTDTAAYAVGVSHGLHVHPDVTLTLVPSHEESVNFQGQFVDGLTVEGELSGWRFVELPLTLRRVP